MNEKPEISPTQDDAGINASSTNISPTLPGVIIFNPDWLGRERSQQWRATYGHLTDLNRNMKIESLHHLAQMTPTNSGDLLKILVYLKYFKTKKLNTPELFSSIEKLLDSLLTSLCKMPNSYPILENNQKILCYFALSIELFYSLTQKNENNQNKIETLESAFLQYLNNIEPDILFLLKKLHDGNDWFYILQEISKIAASNPDNLRILTIQFKLIERKMLMSRDLSSSLLPGLPEAITILTKIDSLLVKQIPDEAFDKNTLNRAFFLNPFGLSVMNPDKESLCSIEKVLYHVFGYFFRKMCINHSSPEEFLEEKSLQPHGYSASNTDIIYDYSKRYFTYCTYSSKNNIIPSSILLYTHNFSKIISLYLLDYLLSCSKYFLSENKNINDEKKLLSLRDDFLPHLGNDTKINDPEVFWKTYNNSISYYAQSEQILGKIDLIMLENIRKIEHASPDLMKYFIDNELLSLYVKSLLICFKNESVSPINTLIYTCTCMLISKEPSITKAFTELAMLIKALPFPISFKISLLEIELLCEKMNQLLYTSDEKIQTDILFITYRLMKYCSYHQYLPELCMLKSYLLRMLQKFSKNESPLIHIYTHISEDINTLFAQASLAHGEIDLLNQVFKRFTLQSTFSNLPNNFYILQIINLLSSTHKPDREHLFLLCKNFVSRIVASNVDFENLENSLSSHLSLLDLYFLEELINFIPKNHPNDKNLFLPLFTMLAFGFRKKISDESPLQELARHIVIEFFHIELGKKQRLIHSANLLWGISAYHYSSVYDQFTRTLFDSAISSLDPLYAFSQEDGAKNILFSFYKWLIKKHLANPISQEFFYLSLNLFPSEMTHNSVKYHRKTEIAFLEIPCSWLHEITQKADFENLIIRKCDETLKLILDTIYISPKPALNTTEKPHSLSKSASPKTEVPKSSNPVYKKPHYSEIVHYSEKFLGINDENIHTKQYSILHMSHYASSFFTRENFHRRLLADLFSPTETGFILNNLRIISSMKTIYHFMQTELKRPYQFTLSDLQSAFENEKNGLKDFFTRSLYQILDDLFSKNNNEADLYELFFEKKIKTTKLFIIILEIISDFLRPKKSGAVEHISSLTKGVWNDSLATGLLEEISNSFSYSHLEKYLSSETITIKPELEHSNKIKGKGKAKVSYAEPSSSQPNAASHNNSLTAGSSRHTQVYNYTEWHNALVISAKEINETLYELSQHALKFQKISSSLKRNNLTTIEFSFLLQQFKEALILIKPAFSALRRHAQKQGFENLIPLFISCHPHTLDDILCLRHYFVHKHTLLKEYTAVNEYRSQLIVWSDIFSSFSHLDSKANHFLSVSSSGTINFASTLPSPTFPINILTYIDQIKNTSLIKEIESYKTSEGKHSTFYETKEALANTDLPVLLSLFQVGLLQLSSNDNTDKASIRSTLQGLLASAGEIIKASYLHTQFKFTPITAWRDHYYHFSLDGNMLSLRSNETKLWANAQRELTEFCSTDPVGKWLLSSIENTTANNGASSASPSYKRGTRK